MTAFVQELTGRYAAAGGDRPDLDARRVARAVFVRDTIRTLHNADKKFGIDPADNGSLAELVDAAEEHLEHIANDVSRRSVMASPTTGGDTT
jgi:hypothetical protein